MHLLSILAFLLLQPLRFAWLSDTHVGSETGAEDLRAAVRDLNAMPGLEFAVISGDVTEFGSDAQLTLARQILDSLKLPYHIIPGNHDTKWSESACRTFVRLWGNDRFVFDAGGIRFVGLHEGPRLRMADGHFAPEDLRWLDSVLAAMPVPDQPLFFITHYPLDSSIANWYEALERLRRQNTQMVLVGHGHRNRIDSYEGVPGLMGRSLLRAGKPAGGFTVVTVTADSVFAAEHTVGSLGAAAPPLPWFSGKRSGGAGTTAEAGRPGPLSPVGPGGPGGAASPGTPAARPDFAVNTQYGGVREVWRWRSGWTMGAAPAGNETMIVTGDASGRVTALGAATGKRLWHFRSGGPVYSTPVVVGDRVVFGSADGYVYCLQKRTGRLLWRTATGGPVLGSPAVDGQQLFIGGSDRRFRSLALASGKLLWRSDSLQGFVETRPLLADGKVIFGAWDGHLYALEKRTGITAWTWTGGRPGVLYSPAACIPVAAHGKVFIVAPDREMTAIDIGTGRTLWRTGVYQVRESLGRSVDGSRVYVRTMRDSIVAVDAAASTCTPVWISKAGFGYDINPAALVESRGIVYYGTKNGLLLALEASDGRLLWKHRVGVAAVNTVLPLKGGRVVTTDLDGQVCCIAGPAESVTSTDR